MPEGKPEPAKEGNALKNLVMTAKGGGRESSDALLITEVKDYE